MLGSMLGISMEIRVVPRKCGTTGMAGIIGGTNKFASNGTEAAYPLFCRSLCTLTKSVIGVGVTEHTQDVRTILTNMLIRLLGYFFAQSTQIDHNVVPMYTLHWYENLFQQWLTFVLKVPTSSR